jgi:hypothetical protein
VSQNETTTLRSSSEELRLRCNRLREQSRELRQRSQLWRSWMPSGLRPAEAADLQRLLRAESDLEGAIAECRAALEDVRRELRWQDPRNPSVIH